MDNGIDKFRNFVQLHHQQLIASQVPEHFWRTLYRKLATQNFDAGDAFQLLLLDYSETERCAEDPVWTVAVSKEDGIKHSNPAEIYIVDHAWTFRTNMARNQLRTVPELLRRMTIIMGIDQEELDADECVEKVMSTMWKHTQMYAIGGDGVSVEDRMPIWYVMDELGSGVTHSDSPNFRLAPFMFVNDQTTYSILFPIQDCDAGEYVTRDFVEGTGTKDEETRRALLLPWKHSDFSLESIEQKEPDMEYFLAGHVEESLPDAATKSPVVDRSRPLKVYATYLYINAYLNDPSFELVDNEQDADIIWVNNHFKKYNELSLAAPHKFINQFPFENVMTIKDLLCIVARRMAHKHHDDTTLDTYPQWLPTTYNLKTELPQFVSYFQRREQSELDNHWIIKPWNLARGLDMHITNDLAQIMRLQPTGPKIAQKYIERPVLFQRPEVSDKCGVKFDVRYVILLSSVEPLTAYVYRNFFLRFANKPFALDRYDDYEQHFTVMNYAPSFQLRHIPCEEFGELWAEQYPNNEWDAIETDIVHMLKELLLGASAFGKAPCAIAPSPQSRALYAADIMLEWSDAERTKIQPKLLEVNWGPDCKRACEYYPSFYNDVFRLLFLDEPNDKVFRKISV